MRTYSWKNPERWVILCVYLILTLCGTTHSQAELREVYVNRVEYHLEELRFFYLTGNYPDALRLTERLLKDAHPSARRLTLLRLLKVEALRGGLSSSLTPPTTDGGEMASLESLLRGVLKLGDTALLTTLKGLYPGIGDALLRVALWHMERGHYMQALAFMEEGRVFLTAPLLVDAGLIRAYSLLKLDRREQALEALEDTVELAGSLLEAYRKVVEGSPPEKPWQMFPQRKELAGPGGSYAMLSALASLYRARLEEVNMLSTGLEERLLAREKALAELKQAVEESERLLKRLSGLLAVRYHAVSATVELHAERVILRWQKLLNRKLTDAEKTTVYLSLLDGRDGLWYLDNTMYCQLLYLMTLEDERISGKDGTLFESILKDLESTASAQPTAISQMVSPVERLVRKATERDTRLLKELKGVINSIKTSLKTIDENMEHIRTMTLKLSERYAMEEVERLKSLIAELKDLTAEGINTPGFDEARLLRLLTPRLFTPLRT